MKNKLVICLTIIIVFIAVIGSYLLNNNKYAIEFKKEYEVINGKTNKKGKEYRTITIDKDNPYIKVTPEEIINKIENKETFYLYVGDPLCPWCRSVLEKSIEVAKENDINIIYYIDIWDDNGNEILRDKYELKDGIPTKVVDGTEVYNKLLTYFDSVLKDYTLTDSNDKKIEVGEKRIFAPNFFHIENGFVKKMTDGISEKQKDAYEELTEDILDDEQILFEEFFAEICDERC